MDQTIVHAAYQKLSRPERVSVEQSAKALVGAVKEAAPDTRIGRGTALEILAALGALLCKETGR